MKHFDDEPEQFVKFTKKPKGTQPKGRKKKIKPRQQNGAKRITYED